MKYSYDRSKPTTKIEIEVVGKDGADSLQRLLKFIRFMGSIGTSRGIYVDDVKPPIAGWDGDGADAIAKLRVDGKEIEMSEEDRKEFNELLG